MTSDDRKFRRTVAVETRAVNRRNRVRRHTL